jgi:hypothetical protein
VQTLCAFFIILGSLCFYFSCYNWSIIIFYLPVDTTLHTASYLCTFPKTDRRITFFYLFFLSICTTIQHKFCIL